MAEDILAQKVKVTWERHSIADIACETQPRNQRHSIWHLNAEADKTARERDKRETRAGAGVTASGIQPQRRRHRETSGRWQTQGDNPRASVTASGIQTQSRHDPGASVTASGIRPQRLGDTTRLGDTKTQVGAQHLAFDLRDWETQGDSGRRPRKPASQHPGCDRRDWETQGDKQETRETQGDKRETRPWSQHLASDRRDWETGRQAENRTRNRRHTFPFSIPQVRTSMLRCLGNDQTTPNKLSFAP